MVDRGVEEGPDERHQQGRGDALPGDVRDHDAQRATAAAKLEQVEEITTDLARGLVMGSDVVARHVPA